LDPRIQLKTFTHYFLLSLSLGDLDSLDILHYLALQSEEVATDCPKPSQSSQAQHGLLLLHRMVAGVWCSNNRDNLDGKLSNNLEHCVFVPSIQLPPNQLDQSTQQQSSRKQKRNLL
jgi:hypothetical protein